MSVAVWNNARDARGIRLFFCGCSGAARISNLIALSRLGTADEEIRTLFPPCATALKSRLKRFSLCYSLD